MGKTIQTNKKKSRPELDNELAKLKSGKKPIDLNKYLGKIDFETDGLNYQLIIRNEWK